MEGTLAPLVHSYLAQKMEVLALGKQFFQSYMQPMTLVTKLYVRFRHMRDFFQNLPQLLVNKPSQLTKEISESTSD